MPEFEIKRTGPNPMDCEVIVHPSATDDWVIKARESLKGVEIKGVQCKSSSTPLSAEAVEAELTAAWRAASNPNEMLLISTTNTAEVKKKYYESADGLDSLTEFETPEEEAHRKTMHGAFQPYQWMKLKPEFLYDGKPQPPVVFIPSTIEPVREQSLSRLNRQFLHDLDVNSSYMYQYVPYSIAWNVRCDYRDYKDHGVLMIHVVVSSQAKHKRRLRQLKKKMAHTKAINRQAVRDEYKATIARREQFIKHINSGLRIRDDDKPKYDWEALRQELEENPIRHSTMIAHLPQ